MPKAFDKSFHFFDTVGYSLFRLIFDLSTWVGPTIAGSKVVISSVQVGGDASLLNSRAEPRRYKQPPKRVPSSANINHGPVRLHKVGLIDAVPGLLLANHTHQELLDVSIRRPVAHQVSHVVLAH